AGRRPVRERGLNEEGMADRKRRICLGGVNEARQLLDRWKPPAFSIADSLRVAVALGGRPILPSCLRRLLPHEPCLVVPDGFVAIRLEYSEPFACLNGILPGVREG